jgi:hypothetical protein
MIDDLVGVRATPPENLPGDPAQDTRLTRPSPDPAGATSRRSIDAGPPPEQPPQFALESLRIVNRIDPLALTPDEHQLITLLGPPLITSPRTVKRLANSYGLLVATSAADGVRGGHRPDLQAIPDLDLGQEAYPYRAGMVLLAAVLGFPMLGPTLFPDLHRTARNEPSTPWTHYLNGLRPESASTSGASRIEPIMCATRAKHWHALLDALNDIGDRASAAGLPLPRRLDVWARWVVPVGRLSFPTGSAVSRLMQSPDQRPTTDGQ